ncbi:MAG: hypothetical protein MUD14_16825 [Hydrococcus sp. Prado102]|jgi:hypothetical protein|nr:hypothetical protein [Hydrococcus sp. Prado102]
MAGPFRLAPQEVQYNIPTWHWPHNTTVIVDAAVNGSVEMKAGGSPPETTSINPGNNQFSRSFGGVLLAVKNLSPADITVSTH